LCLQLHDSELFQKKEYTNNGLLRTNVASTQYNYNILLGKYIKIIYSTNPQYKNCNANETIVFVFLFCFKTRVQRSDQMARYKLVTNSAIIITRA